MEIIRNATAGTLESSDVMICVEPAAELNVEISTVVADQYLDAISKTIYEVLDEFGIKAGYIRANDRGALDCVIRARMETAIVRGGRKS